MQLPGEIPQPSTNVNWKFCGSTQPTQKKCHHGCRQRIFQTFGHSSPLSKIFKWNILKLSYSCIENISSIITSHNKKSLALQAKTQKQNVCATVLRKLRTKSKSYFYYEALYKKNMYSMTDLLYDDIYNNPVLKIFWWPYHWIWQLVQR